MKTEKQIAAIKQFASEKKSSMKRRDDHTDYRARKMYMITIEVEGRRPLFGQVVGSPFAPKGSDDAPHMVLSPLGTAVREEWLGIPRYYPQIEVMTIQVMPDHLHGIIFVREALPVHLGQVIAGFKKGCERKWKAMHNTAVAQLQPTINGTHPSSAPFSVSPPVAAVPQQSTSVLPQVAAVPKQSTSVPPQVAAVPQQSSPRLFALGYNDLILKNYDEFINWKHYLADNPFRLAMKRAHPDYLRVKLSVDVCGRSCSTVGNLSLLSAPLKLRVRISRSIAPTLLEQETERLLAAAREGAVLVSAAISPGEKVVVRAAFNEGLPLIILLDNGLAPLSKPSGERFRACAEGRILLLSPFPHHNNHQPITRAICDTLNALAWDISGGKG
ncbi:MAG: hypothetical protein J5486_06835 [Bacteroidaceae bacterium]|nr:hypothetical protein [Bacteroidaceae bacterium]